MEVKHNHVAWRRQVTSHCGSTEALVSSVLIGKKRGRAKSVRVCAAGSKWSLWSLEPSTREWTSHARVRYCRTLAHRSESMQFKAVMILDCK